jgi:hypothetical protein
MGNAQHRARPAIIREGDMTILFKLESMAGLVVAYGAHRRPFYRVSAIPGAKS